MPQENSSGGIITNARAWAAGPADPSCSCQCAEIQGGKNATSFGWRPEGHSNIFPVYFIEMKEKGFVLGIASFLSSEAKLLHSLSKASGTLGGGGGAGISRH